MTEIALIKMAVFVKQLFRVQIQKGGKVLLWNQVKSRIGACYSELILVKIALVEFAYQNYQQKALKICPIGPVYNYSMKYKKI